MDADPATLTKSRTLRLLRRGRLHMERAVGVCIRVSAMSIVRAFRVVFLALLLLLAGAEAAPLVVIDAGHGGFARGGMPGQRIPEKDYAPDVARRLDSVLRAAGYRTVLTRS